MNIWLFFVGFYSLNYTYAHMYVPFVAYTYTISDMYM